MRERIAAVAAVLWFLFVLSWMILLLPLCLLMILSDINVMSESGFATQTLGLGVLFFVGIFFGITMLVPAFRLCYRKLPWLYPYTVVLMMDILIASIAEEILNHGYQVDSEVRHTLFWVLMVAQIVICRLLMCLYLKKRPARITEDEYEG